MIVFELPKELEDWTDKHCEHCESHATAGEHFAYEFVPSGIVTVCTVRCLVCKEKKIVFVD